MSKFYKSGEIPAVMFLTVPTGSFSLSGTPGFLNNPGSRVPARDEHNNVVVFVQPNFTGVNDFTDVFNSFVDRLRNSKKSDTISFQEFMSSVLTNKNAIVDQNGNSNEVMSAVTLTMSFDPQKGELVSTKPVFGPSAALHNATKTWDAHLTTFLSIPGNKREDFEAIEGPRPSDESLDPMNTTRKHAELFSAALEANPQLKANLESSIKIAYRNAMSRSGTQQTGSKKGDVPVDKGDDADVYNGD